MVEGMARHASPRDEFVVPSLDELTRVSHGAMRLGRQRITQMSTAYVSTIRLSAGQGQRVLMVFRSLYYWM